MVISITLALATAAALLWFGIMYRRLERRVTGIAEQLARAAFVPPCAHEWRKVAETVVPSVRSGGFQSRGYSAWEVANIRREQLEAAQGSTVLVLACDKCGATQTETVKGAPR